MEGLVNNLLEGLFPNYCRMCGLRSYRATPMCSACEADLIPNHQACRRCARPLPGPPTEDSACICGTCLAHPPPFDRVVAPWIYEEQMAFLVGRWKFHAEHQLTPLLATLWVNGATPNPLIDTVIPVPLHWRRLLQRGFNQSEHFARALRRQNPALRELRLRTDIVSRSRHTTSQAQLGARQRWDNLGQAFKLKRSCNGLQVALIDDIMTTGATATALASLLKAAGAKTVEVWCIARTPDPTV